MAEVKPGPGELEDPILPWSQVKVISSLSRTTVWRLQCAGGRRRPPPVSPQQGAFDF